MMYLALESDDYKLYLDNEEIFWLEDKENDEKINIPYDLKELEKLYKLIGDFIEINKNDLNKSNIL